MTPLDGDKMYPGGPTKPEDMYPPGGPPQGAGEVYATANSATPFGFATQQPPYPTQYGPPPGRGGYPPPPQGGYGGYPPPQGGYGYPPQGGGYPPPHSPTTYPQGPGGYYGQQAQGIPMQQTGPYRPGRGASDPEYGEDGFSGFTDAEVRQGFVKKVYTILSIQLAVTAAIVYPFLYSDAVQEYMDDHAYLMFVAMIVYLIVMIALVCCEGVRRSFPINLILLAILTVVMGVMCGMISSRYQTEIVMIAFGMTALVCGLVTLIACCAPVDITGCGLLMCIIALSLTIFGLVSMVLVTFFQMKIMILIYSGLAVVAFSLFLMFDTQQIMGGKRVELSPEEYVFGALQLYVDIIQIFLNLLPLVAACFGGDD